MYFSIFPRASCKPRWNRAETRPHGPRRSGSGLSRLMLYLIIECSRNIDLGNDNAVPGIRFHERSQWHTIFDTSDVSVHIQVPFFFFVRELLTSWRILGLYQAIVCISVSAPRVLATRLDGINSRSLCTDPIELKGSHSCAGFSSLHSIENGEVVLR
jgi:hypothetical protein